MTLSTLILAALFYLTALIYASAGFAGGSTYLALLALAGFSYQLMPATALVCNVVVAAGGAFHYARAGHFRLKNVLPFLLTSVPLAYVGGRLPIGKQLFMLLLGGMLFVAAIRLLLNEQSFRRRAEPAWTQAWLTGLPIGALLGLVSGLTGIGGGILLSPVLYLLGWADAKQVAAASSLFILANSISGLLGQWQKGGSLPELSVLAPLVVSVIVGGQIGASLGANRFPKLVVQRVSAVLVMLVSAKLLWEFF